MHLPQALLASLRAAALGSTALLGAACDEPAPAPSVEASQPAQAVLAATRTEATVTSPTPARSIVASEPVALDAGRVDEIPAPPARRGRLREREAAPTTVAAPSVPPAAVRDAATRFEPCEPAAVTAAARPRPRTAPAATPPRPWSCGPCGRG